MLVVEVDDIIGDGLVASKATRVIIDITQKVAKIVCIVFFI